MVPLFDCSTENRHITSAVTGVHTPEKAHQAPELALSNETLAKRFDPALRNCSRKRVQPIRNGKDALHTIYR